MCNTPATVRSDPGRWGGNGALDEALRAAGLGAGDTLLVASGRVLHALSRQPLPSLSGVLICPTVGGTSEPEAWHQTNEIVREVAERVGGRPQFLWAPALPSPAMRASLDQDPDFRGVTGHWDVAKAALVGVGAPPLQRDSISTAVPLGSRFIRRAAGDVCLNFYDRRGRGIEFEGSDRMVRISPAQLRAVPTVIAAATGKDKAGSIIAGARAGYFDELVTDRETASAVLAELRP
ncbi:sugar-binding domain-containing protein [Naumannella halotolerans]|nr:sugar-binding domain-containing protein [Naumannella halotolerans]